eukprot:15464387-Alexandrium_andersonii.AAC.1
MWALHGRPSEGLLLRPPQDEILKLPLERPLRVMWVDKNDSAPSQGQRLVRPDNRPVCVDVRESRGSPSNLWG